VIAPVAAASRLLIRPSSMDASPGLLLWPLQSASAGRTFPAPGVWGRSPHRQLLAGIIAALLAAGCSKQPMEIPQSPSASAPADAAPLPTATASAGVAGTAAPTTAGTAAPVETPPLPGPMQDGTNAGEGKDGTCLPGFTRTGTGCERARVSVEPPKPSYKPPTKSPDHPNREGCAPGDPFCGADSKRAK
jgi:hypothetical protein